MNKHDCNDTCPFVQQKCLYDDWIKLQIDRESRKKDVWTSVKSNVLVWGIIGFATWVCKKAGIF